MLTSSSSSSTTTTTTSTTSRKDTANVLKEKDNEKEKEREKDKDKGAILMGSQGDAKTKRKAEDTMNPLLKAAKKQKKDVKQNKRKLAGAEETRGGLLIVRAPSAPVQPPASQPLHATSSSSLGIGPPPSKKFRAISQPPASSSSSSSLHPRARELQQHARVPGTPDPDPVLERAVRDMDDEVDRLRRTSRAPVEVPIGSKKAENPFAFSTLPSAKPGSQQGQGQVGKKPRKSVHPVAMDIDTQQPVALNETPQIERNKKLREGSLALIKGTSSGSSMESLGEEERGRGLDAGTGQRHRRKSSLSRGKRISSVGGSGITQPHPTVTDSSFYKHIDADLPDTERLRQLLIWCSLRASGSTLGSSSFTPSKPKPSPAIASLPSASSLPALSEKAKAVLKEAQDELVRMIADKRVDLSLYGGEKAQEEAGGEQVENEQNVRNRNWEVVYGGHVKKAQEEEESWKKVSYAYEAYVKKVQGGIEKDLSVIASTSAAAGPSRARSVSVEPEQGEPMTPSAKAKGKQREVLPRQIKVDDLPEDLKRGYHLARSIAPSSKLDKGKGKAVDRPIPSQVTTSAKVEAEIRRLVPDLQYKLDTIFSYASRAKAVARVIEEVIDERFAILGAHLDARLKPPPSISSSTSSTTHMLNTYVPPHSSSSSKFASSREDPQNLLRALSRIDSARPAAMRGDAARQAAREVQRVVGPVAGERRLTAVAPSGPGTPRKAPGTPRRERTPGREREKER